MNIISDEPKRLSIGQNSKLDIDVGKVMSFNLFNSTFNPVIFKRKIFPQYGSELKGVDSQPLKKRKISKTSIVRFDEKPTVMYHHYAMDDHKNAWYNETDYDGFRQECRKALLHIDSLLGDLTQFDHATHCIRGLEDQVSTKEYFMRNKKKRALIRSVLRHQESYRSSGYVDPNKLKVICMMLSQQSKERAKKIGERDEVFATTKESDISGEKR